jgi:undecaprenyl-diphosphatase
MPDPTKHDSLPPQRPWWLFRAATWSIGLIRGLFEWIGRHELSVLLAMTGAALAVFVFVRIADAVTEGQTLRFDEWAVRAMRRADDAAQPIGPPWLAEVTRDVTALGGVAVLSLIVIAVLGFLWLRRMVGAMWLVIAATVGGLIVSTILKQ